jgi:hypothetical protein
MSLYIKKLVHGCYVSIEVIHDLPEPPVLWWQVLVTQKHHTKIVTGLFTIVEMRAIIDTIKSTKHQFFMRSDST